MKHELKIWPCYFERVLDGTKTFEVRDTHDRSFQKGDVVVLNEYNPDDTVAKCLKYSGRKAEFFIGYVLPLDNKKVVFSLLKSMDVLPRPADRSEG